MTLLRHRYRIDVRTYCRPFKQPLLTSRGQWGIRKGAIVRITHPEGAVGFGELAPIPWFGSESLAEALEYCHNLGGRWNPDLLDRMPERLPASRFALESAWLAIRGQDPSRPPKDISNLPICGLLPSGQMALEKYPVLLQDGYSTLKWKIGVWPLQQEQVWLQELRASLPSHIMLRLDANGGLNPDETVQWLELCDRLGIEFLEQPLPASEFGTLLHLNQAFATPIALDESVSTFQDLRRHYQQGWRSIYVIKPAICGSPLKVSRFCLEHQLDVVLSSSLESPIGQQSCLKIADTIQSKRAIGFGIDRFLQPLPNNWPECLWLDSSID